LSAAENELRELYGRYIQAINERRFDDMDQFTHDEINFNEQMITRAEYCAVIQGNIDAVPDFFWWVDELVIDGNLLIARLVDHGTPAKPWLGLEPTGRQINFIEYAIYRFQDGRFNWINVVLDRPSIARQLSGVPEQVYAAQQLY
jgi:predicted ester cyclase